MYVKKGFKNRIPIVKRLKKPLVPKVGASKNIFAYHKAISNASTQGLLG